jgi:hypothetical protein
MIKKPKRSNGRDTLRGLIRGLPTPDDIAATENDILQTSDRGAAIIAACLLERSLEAAIAVSSPRKDNTKTAKMRELGEQSSSFYSNLQYGRAMSLYDDATLSELESIRKIRNVFAHSAKNITFRTPLIARECANLRPAVRHEADFPKSFSTERIKFLSSCIRISKVLLAKAALGKVIGLAERFPQVRQQLAPEIAKWREKLRA